MTTGRSVSGEGADLLRSIGAAGRSFLVHARPRNAGKSTLTNAIVAEAPADLPRTDFFGTEQEVAQLSVAPTRGYLVVAEIGHRGRPGYLAGEEVPRIFALLADGYALASNLHADTVPELFEVLEQNGVSRQTAAELVPYAIKVRALGDPEQADTRRIVEQIHEISLAPNGEPTWSLRYQASDL
ncbi:MAG TPA: hypothetical protein VHC49_20345 [Mycobacteriales bacterium]|nr:hypothetical protein [Mycobacteriales bacterium]